MNKSGALRGLRARRPLAHALVNRDEKIPIFGTGGGETLSREFDVPPLAALPIDLALRESGDSGVPLVEARPDAPICGLFQSIAEQVMAAQGASG